jgi:hypothetical protein
LSDPAHPPRLSSDCHHARPPGIFPRRPPRGGTPLQPRRTSLIAAALLTPGIALADTQWTGAAGNNLWADALNWSNGVPNAAGFATINRYDPAISGIDLGGDTRDIGYLYLTNSDTRLINGTLAVNHIEYDGFGTTTTTATIRANLTTTSDRLELNSINSNARLRIEGPIVGSGFDVFPVQTALAGLKTYTGRTLVNDPSGDATLVDQGAARSTAAVDIGSRLILDNVNVNLPDRLNDGATVRLIGGELQLRGNPEAPSFERLGPVQFADGGGVATLLKVGRLGQTTFQPVVLQAATLQRTGDGIAQLTTLPETASSPTRPQP